MTDIKRNLRNSFLAGIALVAPLAVTIIVLRIIFNWITGNLQPLIDRVPVEYTGDIEIIAQVLAALLMLVLITLIGFVARWSLGQRAFREFDEFMNRIPVIRTIYSSVRQVSNALMDSQNQYDRVVLIEWTGKDTYLLGFVTNEAPRAVREKIGEKTYNVFLPMSPNPMTGRLAMVPDSRIIDVDMRVKRGLQTLVTTGMTSDQDEIEVPGEEITTEELMETDIIDDEKVKKAKEKVKEKTKKEKDSEEDDDSG